jgi:GNAT superfamily N-acetyltransferase
MAPVARLFIHTFNAKHGHVRNRPKSGNSDHGRRTARFDPKPSFSVRVPAALGYYVLVLMLRTPRLDEAAILTELCLRSKAVWGYDKEFMQACRDELTLTPSTMQSSHLKVAEIGGCLMGMAQVTVKGDIAELDKLFVEPTQLRSGAGRALFDWAKNTAREAGAVTLVIEADPEASGFYRRMGAIDDGVAPSGSIPGRFTPRLKLQL